MARRSSPLTNPGATPLLGLVAAVVATASVFMPWYSTNLAATEPGSANGWESTAIARGVLGLAVVWGFAALAVVMDRVDMHRLDMRTSELLSWGVVTFALLAGGLATYRLLRPPPPNPDLLTRDIGLFITIGASVVGVIAGIGMASYRESVRRRYQTPMHR